MRTNTSLCIEITTLRTKHYISCTAFSNELSWSCVFYSFYYFPLYLCWHSESIQQESQLAIVFYTSNLECSPISRQKLSKDLTSINVYNYLKTIWRWLVMKRKDLTLFPSKVKTQKLTVWIFFSRISTTSFLSSF